MQPVGTDSLEHTIGLYSIFDDATQAGLQTVCVNPVASADRLCISPMGCPYLTTRMPALKIGKSYLVSGRNRFTEARVGLRRQSHPFPPASEKGATATLSDDVA